VEEVMGEFSIFHWLVVLAVILLLFGGRKIPEVMKGIGEGIRSFKDGMSGTNPSTPPPPVAPPPAAAPPVTPPPTPTDDRK
jgi:sec-independent protein translocase protein TatA